MPYGQGDVVFTDMTDEGAFKRVLAEIGRRGGQARAKALTAKERKAIATKASKAAAKARTKKARERKASQSEKSGR